MNVLVADLDENAAGISEQVSGDNKAIAKVREV